jgi:hypothetical protein
MYLYLASIPLRRCSHMLTSEYVKQSRWLVDLTRSNG